MSKEDHMCSTCCALGVVIEYREHQFVVATVWLLDRVGCLAKKRR